GTRCRAWGGSVVSSRLFRSTDPAPAALCTLSLHDALPISWHFAGQLRLAAAAARQPTRQRVRRGEVADARRRRQAREPLLQPGRDRKSTRLNSSHVSISYAVFCLKKKN